MYAREAWLRPEKYLGFVWGETALILFHADTALGTRYPSVGLLGSLYDIYLIIFSDASYAPAEMPRSPQAWGQ